MKTVFTEKYIQKLLVRDQEYTVWDGEISGFGLRVTPTGRKAFTLQTRIRGKERKTTLGYYPMMSVKEARTAFLLKRDVLQNGPQERFRKPTVPRFDNFTNGAWMQEKFSLLKPTSQRSTLSYLHARIILAFGKNHLDEIDRPVISKWFDAYSQTYPGGANRALEILISILEFAIVCGHIEDNPAKGIRKNPKTVLNRFLSADEIKTVSKVLKSAEKESRDYKQAADITRLLLLTGCRHREITHLRWSMIRGDTITLPDTKTGPREVYLNKQAVAVLQRQPRNGSPWVFPWREDPARSRDNIDLFWRDIRRRAGLEDVRVHDLRHTFASHAIMKGVTVPMVSELLGHRKTSMTLRYTHVSDKDVEAAAERIGSTLQNLLRGNAPKPKGSAVRRKGKGKGKSAIVSFRVNEAELASASVHAKAKSLSLGKWAKDMLDNPPSKTFQADNQSGGRNRTISFRARPSDIETYKRQAEKDGVDDGRGRSTVKLETCNNAHRRINLMLFPVLR